MTLPARLLGAVAVSATAVSLASPAAAGARAGDKTFQQTYPVASKLCAKVAAGTERKRLKRFATQVMADCTALQNTFNTATATVLAARTTLSAQIAADRSIVTAACPKPNNQPPACLQTRAQDDPTIQALRLRLVHAVRHFYRTIEAGRDRFWNAIRALPGERRIREDDPIPILSD
jgi:hypothetical protein